MTAISYTTLAREYKALADKVNTLQGDELQTTLTRIKEIGQQLHDAEAAIPRWHGPSTNYKNDLAKRMNEEIEVHRLCSKLIMNSWWASWLPFDWMHSLAATYYSRKALQIYNKQKSNV
jgi:hypothetical protein